ncbi:MAG: hypothetical protein WB716_10855 [Candidatus Acidiferrales bacterium]
MMKRFPEQPATGKHMDEAPIMLSVAQSNPNLASPEDFEPLENGGAGGETLPFDGSCGDSAAEYRRLLKKGPAGRGTDKPSTPIDEHGRALSK